ncbi:MAG: ATP-binding protein [Oscillospiraceae bacterium]|nr:ATP-binding protein [Oscillospiraceae bacterium]
MESSLSVSLSCLAAYRDLLSLPPLAHLHRLLTLLDTSSPAPDALCSAYADTFYALCEEGYDSLGEWLFDQLRYVESPFGEAAGTLQETPALQAAARQDIQTFSRLAALTCESLKTQIESHLSAEWLAAASALPEWRTAVPFDFEGLSAFYRENGSGILARYRAFVWENQQLTPVPHPDMPGETELFGYRLQRDQVEENTRALLAGHAVNNVLLYGEAGTGKSATVKSLLAVPDFASLRLIEVQKEQLGTLPVLMRQLAGRKQKFILFLDDLTFENGDKTPSVLKTILEGGIEPRPVNTAIYATSNRRHLMREFFSERSKSDELDPEESIQEKAALTERFGLRIPYLGLNQADYLILVEQLANQAHLVMDRETLHRLALQWELYHPGRTPRTARQFIASLAHEAQ